MVTAFTKAGKDKHSLSGLAYVKKCGYKLGQVNECFADRRKEDRKTFEKLGVEVKHLEFFDALWRKKRNLNYIEKLFSVFLNEFEFIYTTHRLHVAKGIIHPEDNYNLEKLKQKLKKIVGLSNKSIVFCPLGIGKHVDHIVVRQICSNTFPRVIYWSDYNYNLYHQPDKDFIAKESLREYRFEKNLFNRHC